MGSNFYIADARQMSNALRDQLKQERGVELGVHKKIDLSDSLYLVGKRHATNSTLDKMPLERLTEGEVALVEDDRAKHPHFTLTMNREILEKLSEGTRLYCTGAPLDIPTVGDLRERMSDPGYRVLYEPNANIS